MLPARLLSLSIPPQRKILPANLKWGLNVPGLQQFHAEMKSKGVQFPMAPAKQDFGGMLAQFVDSEGAHISVSGS